MSATSGCPLLVPDSSHPVDAGTRVSRGASVVTGAPHDNGDLQPPPDSLETHLLSAEYRAPVEPFWRRIRVERGSGYGIIGRANDYGWYAIPSWGRDGCDLGEWPAAVVYHRTRDDGYELAYYVKGDVAVYSYPLRELRDAATDCIALQHWRQRGEPWVAGMTRVEELPEHLRGAFSWNRPTDSADDE